MKIVEVNINELKPAEYNPRGMTKREAKDLKQSLQEFGMVEPIVVNCSSKRKNVIIGGHQRYYLLKQMDKATIPVVYVDIPDLKREQELNLRLNKNLGHWNFDMLANFDEDLLGKAGFSQDEIDKMFALNKEIEGEEDFTTEILEENNYVMFVFDNAIDWNFIREKFGIKTVDSLDSKKGYKRRGVGRVLKGEKLLEILK